MIGKGKGRVQAGAAAAQPGENGLVDFLKFPPPVVPTSDPGWCGARCWPSAGPKLRARKGGDLNAMIAELYGKETGCARGRGGSMHLIGMDRYILGGSAVVGTTIPIAVGYALALQREGRGRVVAAFFGTAPPRRACFTKASTSPPCTSCPCCSCARTTFTRSTSPWTSAGRPGSNQQVHQQPHRVSFTVWFKDRDDLACQSVERFRGQRLRPTRADGPIRNALGVRASFHFRQPVGRSYRRLGAHRIPHFRELRTMREMCSGGPGFSHCFSLTIWRHTSIASSHTPLARSVPQRLTSVLCCRPWGICPRQAMAAVTTPFGRR